MATSSDRPPPQQQQKPAKPPYEKPKWTPPAAAPPPALAGIPVSIDTQTGSFQIRNVAELWELAGHLAKSDLKPRALRSQADVFLVMAYGQMYGFSEMEALQRLHVVKGKVGMGAQDMVAKVRSHPLCRSYRMWCEGDGEERAGCVQSWRHGTEAPNDVVRFTLAEARQAYLYDPAWRDQNNEPSVWVKYPDDQLLWKAAARDYRRNWPDAFAYRIQPIEELREIARSSGDDGDALDVRPLPSSATPPPASPALQALAAGEQRIELELERRPERELVELRPVAERSAEQQRNIDEYVARIEAHPELPQAPEHASEPPRQLTLDAAPVATQVSATPLPAHAGPPPEPVALPAHAGPPPEPVPFAGELEPALRKAIGRRVGTFNLLEEHAGRAGDQLEEMVRMRVGAGVPLPKILAAVMEWRPRLGGK